MKLKKDDIETVRELDRRRLLKLASAGAFVTIAGTSLQTTSAEAKDRNSGDPADRNSYDDRDIRDGRRPSDPADSDPYNGADAD